MFNVGLKQKQPIWYKLSYAGKHPRIYLFINSAVGTVDTNIYPTWLKQPMA